MFHGFTKSALEIKAKLAALDQSQGIVEFDLDGMVLTANQRFLAMMGYSLSEIVGRHHSLFVDTEDRLSPDYKQFWADLRRGKFRSAQYRRLGKGGHEVWIEASYNPILNHRGKPYRIVKFATDITRSKAEAADREGQIQAIRKSACVITFDLNGHVLEANEGFLNAVGYSLPEILGKHHAIFVEPGLARSREYTDFWSRLREGHYQAGRYKRLGKDGREVWIQASYNPIFDGSGRPYKIVKFAADITQQVKLLDNLTHLIERHFGDIEEAVMVSHHEASGATRAADVTSRSVQAVAAAAEELACSVAEISDSMTKSRVVSENVNAQVEAAGRFTVQLSGATTAMSGIVGIIQTIAAQINLLALNATIESARAGDAGRGFAIVAQEIKILANQAAGAAAQISAEIGNVQAVSKGVVGALDTITESVSTLRDYVLATSGAVEQQSVVTHDMSLNMQDAAQAVSAIAQNLIAISSSVTSVSKAVSFTKDAARTMTQC